MLMNPALRHPDQQLEFYRAVLNASTPHGATIRLFDAGGAKVIPGSPTELNPFLGWRGVRLLLDEKHLLQHQMEALLRLSAEYPGQVRLLVPMVSEHSELRRIQQIRHEISDRLKQEGVHPDPALQVGAMIEVPSAALLTESMALYVDFYSIGTNDLIQYTLAADRGNSQVAHLFDSHHPAVWQLIHLAVKGSQKAGKPISVCGEMASHPIFAAAFLGLGIRELSMPPSMIAQVKSLLIQGNLLQYQTLAKDILKSPDVEQVKQVVSDWSQQNGIGAA
jgi:phosphotransferase system enzyme I (PtsI)